jgi:hypothetical protein
LEIKKGKGIRATTVVDEGREKALKKFKRTGKD